MMFQVVGLNGFEVPGLDLPRGTVVKWVRDGRVRHTNTPVPENLWNDIPWDDPMALERSWLAIDEFWTKFVTSPIVGET
jgi:hypothetical protein